MDRERKLALFFKAWADASELPPQIVREEPHGDNMHGDYILCSDLLPMPERVERRYWEGMGWQAYNVTQELKRQGIKIGAVWIGEKSTTPEENGYGLTLSAYKYKLIPKPEYSKVMEGIE